ncbi:MAG TPA: flagellar motor protein MotB [Gaiellaceae bacterium]
MSAPNNRRRRRGEGGGGHDGPDERWLLTYSDMITLLMALFIVMWSISSVNISRFDQLKASLRAAFSGHILPNNDSILSGQTAPFQQPGAPVSPVQPGAQPQNPVNIPSLSVQLHNDIARLQASQDLQNLRRIRRQVEAYARQHGFSGHIRTFIDERGLVIRLLTDDVLFDSGEATLKSPSLPLLAKIANLITHGGITNPVRVEGNTDSVPISTAEFHSNWELSTARANAVLEFLLGHRVGAGRLSVAGYADQRPVESNTTPEGRAANRRVDLVVLRRATTQGSSN